MVAREEWLRNSVGYAIGSGPNHLNVTLNPGGVVLHAMPVTPPAPRNIPSRWALWSDYLRLWKHWTKQPEDEPEPAGPGYYPVRSEIVLPISAYLVTWSDGVETVVPLTEFREEAYLNA